MPYRKRLPVTAEKYGDMARDRRMRARRYSSYARSRQRRTVGFYRRVGNFGRYFPGAYPGENKFSDQTPTHNPISNSGNIQQLCTPIAQGAGESERVGRKINIHSVYARGHLRIPSSTAIANTSDIVRVMLVLDKQANGAVATVNGASGVLETTGTQYLAFNELSNKGRFRVLSDKFYSVNVMNAGWNGTNLEHGEATKYWKLYWKASTSIPIEYSGATGAITEIRSNNLFLLFISSQNTPLTTYMVRVRYSDA